MTFDLFILAKPTSLLFAGFWHLKNFIQ